MIPQCAFEMWIHQRGLCISLHWDVPGRSSLWQWGHTSWEHTGCPISDTASPKVGPAAGISARVGLALRFGLAAVPEGTAQQDSPSPWHLATWGPGNQGSPAGQDCWPPRGGLVSVSQWNPQYFQDCWNTRSVIYEKKYFLYIYFRSQVIFSLPSSFDGIHRWHNKENEHVSIFLDIALRSCFL